METLFAELKHGCKLITKSRICDTELEARQIIESVLETLIKDATTKEEKNELKTYYIKIVKDTKDATPISFD